MVPGQEVTVSFSTPDPAWSEVTEAIGALHLLVENGAARKDLEEKPTAAPRTAVGLRPDGSLVLYTVDGRQNSHSMGAGLDVLAQRMAELGCVTAICLDGGGSTTAVSSGRAAPRPPWSTPPATENSAGSPTICFFSLRATPQAYPTA